MRIKPFNAAIPTTRNSSSNDGHYKVEEGNFLGRIRPSNLQGSCQSNLTLSWRSQMLPALLALAFDHLGHFLLSVLAVDLHSLFKTLFFD